MITVEPELEMVGVICKEKEEVIVPNTPCHASNKVFYPATAIFNDEICYFTVLNGTVKSNPVKNGSYIFDVTMARQICKDQRK